MIVDALTRALQAENEYVSSKLEGERGNLTDPSETDLEALALHRGEVSKIVQQHEATLTRNRAFIEWLGNQRGNPQDPFEVGNFWVLKGIEDLAIWLVYDPKAPLHGWETFVTLDSPQVLGELRADEVLTLSTDCALYARLVGKDIRVGLDITVGVEGNDPDVMRLIEIL
jgi:hypothetical protein